MSKNKEKLSEVMTIRISHEMMFDIEYMADKTKVNKQEYIRKSLRARIRKDKR